MRPEVSQGQESGRSLHLCLRGELWCWGQHQQIEGSNFRGAYWSWVQHAIDPIGQVRAAKQASQCSALSFPRTSPQLGRGALGPLPVEFCILLEGPFSITFSLVVIKPLPLYH